MRKVLLVVALLIAVQPSLAVRKWGNGSVGFKQFQASDCSAQTGFDTNDSGILCYETTDDTFWVWTGSAWERADKAGAGDVRGLSISTDECITRFDGITGKQLQQGEACPVYNDTGQIAEATGLRIDITHPDFGADPTGASDSLAAINAATTKAALSGARVVCPPGTYLISGTVNIGNIDVDCGLAQFTLTVDDDVAVAVDSPERKFLDLPVITKQTQQWSDTVTGSDVGLTVRNANRSRIAVRQITEFTQGMVVIGDGAGNQNNDYYAVLRGNKQAFTSQLASGGWFNENNVTGQFAWFNADPVEPANSWFMRLDSTGGAGAGNNGNTFVVNLETGTGGRPSYIIDCVNCDWNLWEWPRLESQAGAKVRFDGQSDNNRILGGVQAGSVQWENSGDKNVIDTEGGFVREFAELEEQDADGYLKLMPTSSANPTIAQYRATGGGIPGLDATARANAWTGRWGPQAFQMKGQADTEPTVEIQSSGAIVWGDGTSTDDTSLQRETGVAGRLLIGRNGSTGSLALYNELGATDYRVNFVPTSSQTESWSWVLPSSAGSQGQVLARTSATRSDWTNDFTLDISGAGSITGGTADRCARFNSSGELEAFSTDCGSGSGSGLPTDPAACPAGQQVNDISQSGVLSCTVDKTASTVCDGVNVFLDGEGNCTEVTGGLDETTVTCLLADDLAACEAKLPTCGSSEVGNWAYLDSDSGQTDYGDRMYRCMQQADASYAWFFITGS